MEDLAPPHYGRHLQIERAYRGARSWADEVNDGYANRDVDPGILGVPVHSGRLSPVKEEPHLKGFTGF